MGSLLKHLAKTAFLAAFYLGTSGLASNAQAGVPENQYVYFELNTGIHFPRNPESNIQIPLGAGLGFRLNPNWAIGGFFQASSQRIVVGATESESLTQFIGAQAFYYFRQTKDFLGGWNTGLKVAYLRQMNEVTGPTPSTENLGSLGIAPRVGFEKVWDFGGSIGVEVNYFFSTSRDIKGPMHILGQFKIWF